MTPADIIFLGLGANLSGIWGTPQQTLNRAMVRLGEEGVRITARSHFWKTAPVPVSDQPWYINAVVSVETALPPEALLALLHRIEAEAGRVRGVVNAARTLDLDLLAYGRRIISSPDGEKGLIVPHPRLAGRAFVLLPLQDIAEEWIHPVTGQNLTDMISKLPLDQRAERAE